MRLLTLFIASLVSAHGDLKAAIGKPAPDFTAEAVVNGDFQKVYSPDINQDSNDNFRFHYLTTKENMLSFSFIRWISHLFAQPKSLPSGKISR